MDDTPYAKRKRRKEKSQKALYKDYLDPRFGSLSFIVAQVMEDP